MENAAVPTIRLSRNRRGAGLLLSLAVGAALLFAGLGDHALWSDEAGTAIYARNLLRFGELTAWDGTNLVGFSGTTEFDANLVNTYMPPQQYYVAALGMKLFGGSPLGARVFFALTGLAAIGVAAWWTRRFFDSEIPLFLPALLLALTPAFLLFMRNCRYYALAVFWTLLLLALWTACATRGSGPVARRRTIALHLSGVLAVAGLFTSQYLTAAAALAVLPVFFLDARFRSRRQCLFLATLAAAGLCGVLWVLARGSPAETLFQRRESWLRHTATLFGWQLRDMGYFEFFAWPMAAPLALPFLFRKRLAAARPLAARALILLAAFLAFLAVIAAFSPQGLANARASDIRYALPLIAIGVAVAAAALAILSRLHAALAVAVALALLGTNALHLGAWRPQHRQHYYGASPVRSTLLDYFRELADPYVSSNARVNAALAHLPAGSLVWMNPFAFTTSSMFALPHLRYCGQVPDDIKKHSARAAALPDHVFWNGPEPDLLLVLAHEIVLHGDDGVELVGVDNFLRERVNVFVSSGRYTSRELLPLVGYDDTRPEIPYRLFRQPPAGAKPRMAAWVLEKKQAE